MRLHDMPTSVSRSIQFELAYEVNARTELKTKQINKMS